jgi:hypothetical protein
MPGGDRTGPQGFGPMTGRGAGYCAGYGMPGYANPIPGRGWFGRGRGWFGRGWGSGRGRGWRNRFYATGMPGWIRSGPAWPGAGANAYPYAQEITPKQEMDILKDQAEMLKGELEEIQKRIGILEKAKDKPE